MRPIEPNTDEPSEVEQALSSISVPAMLVPIDVRIRSVLHACEDASIPRSRRRRTMLVVVAGAATLAIAAAGGVAASVTSLAPAQRATISCFATQDVAGKDNLTSFDAMVASGPDEVEQDAASQALTLCAEAWQRGELRPTPPYVVAVDPEAVEGRDPVPVLVACILPSGGVGVLPGNERTCQRLGLLSARLQP